jgi:hypothetical protein
MFTFIVVAVLSLLWWQRWNRYQREPTWKNRRRSVAMLYAVIGALIGSYFGVAGFGTAIAGTIPGALVGYLIISALYKVDPEQRAAKAFSGQDQPPPAPSPDEQPRQIRRPSNEVAPVYRASPYPDPTRLITCFHCGAKLEAPANRRLKIRCGGCKGEFEVST